MPNFVDRVRNGKVAQPSQMNFTVAGWKTAFAETPSPNIDDTNLYEIGLWVFDKFESIRKKLKEVEFGAIPRETLVCLLIGATNRTAYIMSNAGLDSPVRENDYLINLLIQAKVGEINRADPDISPDTVLTASIDSVRYPLRLAFSHKTTISEHPDEQTCLDDLLKAVLLGQLYDIYDGIWMDALWNGEKLSRPVPYDVVGREPNEAEIVRAVSEYRRQALAMESLLHFLTAWNIMPSRVKESIESTVPKVVMKGRGTKRRFELGRGSDNDKRSKLLVYTRLLAEKEWYTPFFNIELPNYEGITISDIYAVWEFLHVSIVSFIRSLPPPNSEQKLRTFSSVQLHAPVFYFDQFVKLVKSGIGLSETKIRKVFSFLTADSKSDLWATPIVKLDDRRFVALHAPIAFGNMARTVELWMKRGALRIDESGPNFEAYAKQEVERFITESPLLSESSQVFGPGLEFESDGESEEIDLVVRVDKSILLVEAKCILFPTEALEKHRYFDILEQASRQSRRKLEFIQKNVPDFLSQLGIEFEKVDEYSFYPAILVNQPFGVGFTSSAVPVVDLLILERFFQGVWQKHVLMDAQGNTTAEQTHHFYTSPSEAGDRLWAYLCSPIQIREYARHVKLKGKPVGMLISAEDRPLVVTYLEVELPVGNSSLESKELWV